MKAINRQKIALLFIIVFISTILIKPVHLLFSDHHSHFITEAHSHGKAASIHQDCDICLFMLHAFTPQQFAELEQRFDIYFAEIAQADIQTYAYRLSPQISLRAPPVTAFS